MKFLPYCFTCVISVGFSTCALAQNALVVDSQDRVLGVYLYGLAESSVSTRPAFAILHSSGFVFRVRTLDGLVAGAPVVDRGTFRYENEGEISGVYFASLDCAGQAYVMNQSVPPHYKAGVVFSGDGTGYVLVATEFNAVAQDKVFLSRRIGSDCTNIDTPTSYSALPARIGDPDLAGILPNYSAPLRLVYASECVFKNGFECAMKD